MIFCYLWEFLALKKAVTFYLQKFHFRNFLFLVGGTVYRITNQFQCYEFFCTVYKGLLCPKIYQRWLCFYAAYSLLGVGLFPNKGVVYRWRIWAEVVDDKISWLLALDFTVHCASEESVSLLMRPISCSALVCVNQWKKAYYQLPPQAWGGCHSSSLKLSALSRINGELCLFL